MSETARDRKTEWGVPSGDFTKKGEYGAEYIVDMPNFIREQILGPADPENDRYSLLVSNSSERSTLEISTAIQSYLEQNPKGAISDFYLEGAIEVPSDTNTQWNEARIGSAETRMGSRLEHLRQKREQDGLSDDESYEEKRLQRIRSRLRTLEVNISERMGEDGKEPNVIGVVTEELAKSMNIMVGIFNREGLSRDGREKAKRVVEGIGDLRTLESYLS